MGVTFLFPTQWLELTTNLCEVFTITEKAHTMAFSWLKASTSTLTFKTWSFSVIVKTSWRFVASSDSDTDTAVAIITIVYCVRSLPKISRDEEEGVHQNPQYTGQHHFHPVPHDHDFCERVVINVSNIITIQCRFLRFSWGGPGVGCRATTHCTVTFKEEIKF